MEISNGIVPYASSYLQDAQSKKILSGGHSIQDTPEAVYELQRILRLHLECKTHPSSKIKAFLELSLSLQSINFHYFWLL